MNSEGLYAKLCGVEIKRIASWIIAKQLRLLEQIWFLNHAIVRFDIKIGKMKL